MLLWAGRCGGVDDAVTGACGRSWLPEEACSRFESPVPPCSPGRLFPRREYQKVARPAARTRSKTDHFIKQLLTCTSVHHSPQKTATVTRRHAGLGFRNPLLASPRRPVSSCLGRLGRGETEFGHSLSIHDLPRNTID